MWLSVFLVLVIICCHSSLLAQQVIGTSLNNVAFQFSITPDTIEDSVTQNVTLECANLGPVPSKVSMIANLQILKRQNGNTWITFAEIRENEPNVRTDETVLTSGNIGDRTFLQLVWPIATKETFGQYRCDVAGYDVNFNDAEEHSPVLTVVEHNITARDVLNLMLEDQEYSKQELALQIQEQNDRFSEIVKALNQTQSLNNVLSIQLSELIQIQNVFRNRTESALKDIDVDIESRIAPLVRDISVIYSDLKIVANISHTSTTLATTTASTTLSPLRITACKNNALDSTSDTTSWPEGTFGLLEPDTGCPDDTQCTDWQTGFYKFDTEMDNNHNQVSNPSHLAVPIQEKNDRNKTYMYQRFCVVTEEYPNLPWPNGTYCINHGIKPCPSGFEEGWIHFDEEDKDHPESIVGGVPPYRYIVGNIFYCCRADGPHDTPVVLPTSKPFYLYRYQNDCQVVDGMDVIQEFMLFDTENDNNRDNVDENNYHPDASINDVNITLCYYQRNNK